MILYCRQLFLTSLAGPLPAKLSSHHLTNAVSHTLNYSATLKHKLVESHVI